MNLGATNFIKLHVNMTSTKCSFIIDSGSDISIFKQDKIQYYQPINPNKRFKITGITQLLLCDRRRRCAVVGISRANKPGPKVITVWRIIYRKMCVAARWFSVSLFLALYRESSRFCIFSSYGNNGVVYHHGFCLRTCSYNCWCVALYTFRRNCCVLYGLFSVNW